MQDLKDHSTRSAFRHGRFLTLRVDPLEEGRSTWRVWPNRYYVDIASCSTVGRPPCESKEGLETKVGLRANLCLAGIDYEILELGSDDLILGFGLCLWRPTIALHVHLNSGVEAALICLDSCRLPSCARTPHLTQDGQRRVLRGTQIPYLAAVDLVVGLGVSHGMLSTASILSHTCSIELSGSSSGSSAFQHILLDHWRLTGELIIGCT
ncbi:hypothetical protein M9H77_26979 [Catharanthus roseus]|uniref:Uncharacterized protein n=1 Tax=Catharanthus roseus TaxID=4058 RepID=A0ACC0AFB3_CATRO|nr:hypothetical protein M9H77_26979 [Catharanthus roseus]